MGVMILQLVFTSLLFLAACNSLRMQKLSQHIPNDGMQRDPLLLRTARGERVERTPVWMMRQAGRHMKSYRDLCVKYKTFRERSENVDVAVEISLQPWRRYGTDGCILFSDILTPLPAMGIDFDILEQEGPVMTPWRTMEDVKRISAIMPEKYTPFVRKALSALRGEVGMEATVLGFAGLPYTIATYMVEGGTSNDYKHIKLLSYERPDILHEMLRKLAENLADYVLFQIDSGAQVVQLFDSWAGHLSPEDYDTFCAPYQRMVVERVKRSRPDVPLILYIHRSGALLERMARVGVDIISLDWTVSIDEARRRMGGKVGVQGNLDPALLFAPNNVLIERTVEIVRAGGGHRHVMNLGHGIDAQTPEEKAQLFVDTVKNCRLSQ